MRLSLRIATAASAVLFWSGCTTTENSVSIVNDAPAMTEASAAQLSATILQQRGAIGDVSAQNLTQVRASTIDKLGEGHTRIAQTYRGVPVFGGETVVHLKKDGSLKGLTDGLEHNLLVDTTTPTLTADQAVELAVRSQGGWNGLSPKPAVDLELVKGERQHILSWRVRLLHAPGATPRMPVVFVNATTGAVVKTYDNLQTAKDRRVHNLNHNTTLPGTLTRSEGQAAVGEVDIDTNYDRLGSVYDCYQALFGRDSFDNAGAPLLSSVHYSTNYVNAYWNGTQMVYGDGDNVNSRSLAISMDVTAHELTHAVTERTSGLIYSGESGGLNEAMSDIFGEICEWHRDNAGDITGPTSDKTWMVGEDIWLASPALRYLNDPARDGTSLDFWTTTAGNVDVHYSSGIANLAFYLLAHGGTHPRGKSTIAVTGIGIYDAAKIFYRTNTTYLTPSARFADARVATISAAVDLFGAGSVQATQAANAWAAVGVLPPPNYTVIDTRSGLGADAGTNFNFSYPTPSGTTAMRFDIAGTTGDADLYVRFGSPPTSTAYDCRPYTGSSNEVCEFNPSQSGTYYVMVNAYSSFSGLSLTVRAAGSRPSTETSCTDGIDNDGDGTVDCADSDCVGNTACRPTTETSCTDGVDNDGDGAIDCSDSDCVGNTACRPTTETSCTDGVDNDGDGAIDCADSDCAGNTACRPTTETSCTDGVDNDGDGAIDCADSDCVGNTACRPTTETSCTDGVDNDGDGAIDCADSDCTANAACAPGLVIINEILANEPGNDTAREFVEIANVGGQPVDLSGWTLRDGSAVRHVFAAGTTLGGGHSLVVFGRASGIPAGLSNAVGSSTGSLSLSNSRDTVTLLNGTTVVNSVTYGSQLAARDGVSMNRSPDASATGRFVLHTTLSANPSSPGLHVDDSPF